MLNLRLWLQEEGVNCINSKTKIGYSCPSQLPIFSLFFCLAKVYEYIFNSRLKEFVTAHLIIFPEQVGIDPNYRPTPLLAYSIILSEQFGIDLNYRLTPLWRVNELIHGGYFKIEKLVLYL